jgi:hypothetical protein
MNSHRHLPRASHQLEDADIALAQTVVTDKLGPAPAVEASGDASMVVPDMPLLFAVWPQKQGLI